MMISPSTRSNSHRKPSKASSKSMMSHNGEDKARKATSLSPATDKETLALPEPDSDNITVLTDKLPNKPILPWNRYDSPWKDPEEAPSDPEMPKEPSSVSLSEESSSTSLDEEE